MKKYTAEIIRNRDNGTIDSIPFIENIKDIDIIGVGQSTFGAGYETIFKNYVFTHLSRLDTIDNIYFDYPEEIIYQIEEPLRTGYGSKIAFNKLPSWSLRTEEMYATFIDIKRWTRRKGKTAKFKGMVYNADSKQSTNDSISAVKILSDIGDISLLWSHNEQIAKTANVLGKHLDKKANYISVALTFGGGSYNIMNQENIVVEKAQKKPENSIEYYFNRLKSDMAILDFNALMNDANCVSYFEGCKMRDVGINGSSDQFTNSLTKGKYDFISFISGTSPSKVVNAEIN